MGIWGYGWSAPAAADLAHPLFSLRGFSLTSLYQQLNPGTSSLFPIPACIVPPFLQQEVREAKPDR